jgi:hypothetical protein
MKIGVDEIVSLDIINVEFLSEKILSGSFCYFKFIFS